MHLVWGVLTIVIGILMFIGGVTESKFVLYRLLVARSRGLWGRHVHRFYQASGIAVAIVGALIALRAF